MGITVKEALSIYPLSTAKVRGGSQGLEREIRFLNIMEVPNVDEWLRGGELLFSSGFAIRDTPESFVQLIERLSGRGVAALAIRLSDYLPQFTPAMVERADQVGLPLLELRRNVPYMDYMEPLLEVLINAQLRLFKTTEDISSRLLGSMLSNRGLSGVILTLEQIIGAPACVLDRRGKILCREACSSPVHAEMSQALADFLAGPAFDALPSGKYSRVTTADGVFGCIPVNDSSRQRSALVTREDSPLPRETSILAQEHAATFVALEMMTEDMVNQREQQMRGDLLDALLEKTQVDEEAALRRAALMDVHLEQPYCLILVGFSDSQAAPAPALDPALPRLDVKQTLMNSLKTALPQSDGSRLLLHHRGDHVIALLEPAHLTPQRLRQALREELSRLAQRYPRLRLACGYSELHTGPAQVRQAYEQALTSLRIAQRSSGETPLIAYGELGIFRVLDAADSQAQIRAYVEASLGPVLRYKYSQELLDTLRTYFSHGQNASATAKALFLHKNTVLYRLEKAEELLGLDLRDYESSFNLQFCLKAQALLL